MKEKLWIKKAKKFIILSYLIFNINLFFIYSLLIRFFIKIQI